MNIGFGVFHLQETEPYLSQLCENRHIGTRFALILY